MNTEPTDPIQWQVNDQKLLDAVSFEGLTGQDVLTAMQHCAADNSAAARDTLFACNKVSPEHLTPEQHFKAWSDFLLEGKHLSAGLRFLDQCGWARKYYPELAAMKGCRQDPDHHPEGDVWTHTLHCMDAFAGDPLITEDERLVVGLAVLCHDFAKPLTQTLGDDNRICFPNHEKLGRKPSEAFLTRIGCPEALFPEILELVEFHGMPYALHYNQARDHEIKEFAGTVGNLERLIKVSRADHCGRPPIPADSFPAGEWLADQATGLGLM